MANTSVYIILLTTYKRCKELELLWIYPTHFKHQLKINYLFSSRCLSIFHFPDMCLDIWNL